MRVCDGFVAVFDDPNLVSCAGLAQVLQLAERAGLHGLVGKSPSYTTPGHSPSMVSAQVKIIPIEQDRLRSR